MMSWHTDDDDHCWDGPDTRSWWSMINDDGHHTAVFNTSWFIKSILPSKRYENKKNICILIQLLFEGTRQLSHEPWLRRLDDYDNEEWDDKNIMLRQTCWKCLVQVRILFLVVIGWCWGWSGWDWSRLVFSSQTWSPISCNISALRLITRLLIQVRERRKEDEGRFSTLFQH